MKFSARFYGLLAILGLVFLALVVSGAYLDGADSLSILVILSPMSSSKVGLCFVFDCIASLTVGMVGIIRQYLKNHRKLFTALAILLIPPLTFATLVVGSVNAFWSAPMDPLRSEITQVTVVDTNPLVLSVDVKAITSKNTWIESALILNSTGSEVAQIPSEEVWKAECAEKGYFTLAELPGGSEISLTLDFNTTLPSGNYLVKLTCWCSKHGSSSFSIL